MIAIIIMFCKTSDDRSVLLLLQNEVLSAKWTQVILKQRKEKGWLIFGWE